jgi:hypothetical protein
MGRSSTRLVHQEPHPSSGPTARTVLRRHTHSIDTTNLTFDIGLLFFRAHLSRALAVRGPVRPLRQPSGFITCRARLPLLLRLAGGLASFLPLAVSVKAARADPVEWGSLPGAYSGHLTLAIRIPLID